jgi:Uma2 family endonuclease
MAALPERKLTVDEFLKWSEMTPGRFELLHGQIIEMQAERRIHAKIKFKVQTALQSAIGKAGLACEMLPDGMTVRIDKDTAFEPDALIYCGPALPPSVIEVPKPVIVVEVLSPSTKNIDSSEKLDGYFQLPSIMHYLIVHPEKLPVIHHARQTDGTILTRLVNRGAITMTPPGIEISLMAC